MLTVGAWAVATLRIDGMKAFFRHRERGVHRLIRKGEERSATVVRRDRLFLKTTLQLAVPHGDEAVVVRHEFVTGEKPARHTEESVDSDTVVPVLVDLAKPTPPA
ncbi:MAG TPA: hypothetical protein VFC86_03570 [Planctomycetota bacterium]|nr:hypothetical protein [Planctomycetota bacterium]